MGKALLVVDMQVGLIPLVWQGQGLAERITALATAARTQGVPVIAVQQTGPAGTPLAEGTPEWHLIAGLIADERIQKQATDSFYETDLAARLATRNVDTVVIAGVATDYCVDATARSALSHGLNVILVSDAHAPGAGGDPESGLTPHQVIAHHNAVLSKAIHPGGHLSLVPAAAVFTTAR